MGSDAEKMGRFSKLVNYFIDFLPSFKCIPCDYESEEEHKKRIVCSDWGGGYGSGAGFWPSKGCGGCYMPDVGYYDGSGYGKGDGSGEGREDSTGSGSGITQLTTAKENAQLYPY